MDPATKHSSGNLTKGVQRLKEPDDQRSCVFLQCQILHPRVSPVRLHKWELTEGDTNGHAKVGKEMSMEASTLHKEIEATEESKR